MASWAAQVGLTYPASVEDRAGVSWSLLLQLIGPPANVKMYPLVEFQVSMSVCICEAIHFIRIVDTCDNSI